MYKAQENFLISTNTFARPLPHPTEERGQVRGTKEVETCKSFPNGVRDEIRRKF